MAHPIIASAAGLSLKKGDLELSLTLSFELNPIVLLYMAQYFLA